MKLSQEPFQIMVFNSPNQLRSDQMCYHFCHSRTFRDIGLNILHYVSLIANIYSFQNSIIRFFCGE